jgi:hypothetical protein
MFLLILCFFSRKQQPKILILLPFLRNVSSQLTPPLLLRRALQMCRKMRTTIALMPTSAQTQPTLHLQAKNVRSVRPPMLHQ